MLNMRKTTGRYCKASGDQVEAIYRWEESWHYWNRDALTIPECRAVIRTAYAKYGLPPPLVRSHHGSYSWCVPAKNTISIQRARKPGAFGGRNLATCLHEAAHGICHHFHSTRIEDHGRTFLGVFMWLLEAARVAPDAALHASARKFKLKWAHRPPSYYKCKP